MFDAFELGFWDFESNFFTVVGEDCVVLPVNLHQFERHRSTTTSVWNFELPPPIPSLTRRIWVGVAQFLQVVNPNSKRSVGITSPQVQTRPSRLSWMSFCSSSSSLGESLARIFLISTSHLPPGLETWWFPGWKPVPYKGGVTDSFALFKGKRLARTPPLLSVMG